MNSQSNLSPGESLDFLRLLSKQFPSIQSVCTEIINLEAILDLPKGTEHFISDLHGEYEAVAHILNNASGVIREKIDLLYADTVSEEERSKLATLIYYPHHKLASLRAEHADDLSSWYHETLVRLIDICRVAARRSERRFPLTFPISSTNCCTPTITKRTRNPTTGGSSQPSWTSAGRTPLSPLSRI